MASRIRAKAVGATGNTTIVDTSATGDVAYFGFSIRETAGATALVRVRQGTSSGLILDEIPLAANQGIGAFYGPDGIRCEGDLIAEVQAGTVEGSIYFG